MNDKRQDLAFFSATFPFCIEMINSSTGLTPFPAIKDAASKISLKIVYGAVRLSSAFLRRRERIGKNRHKILSYTTHVRSHALLKSLTRAKETTFSTAT